MIDHPYPLQWPVNQPRTPIHDRERARFSKKNVKGWQAELTINDAVKRLMEEISAFTRAGRDWRIDPEEVIISSDLKMRKDGLPYSSQRTPDDPGIAVYLELDGVPHVFPCDRWDRIADNIAAVAAHLGALRGIERWGVGDLKTAFTGWAALEHNTRPERWYDVLGVPPDANETVVKSAYKRLRSAYHPDKKNGDAGQFDRVQKAYQSYLDSL